MNEGDIRSLLDPTLNERVAEINRFEKIDSTNAWLLNEPAPSIDQWCFAIADRQTAGRGRSGKKWHSPAGGGLWMSGAYTFNELPENLSALTLAIGVGAAKVLQAIGVQDLRLKWPNDLLAGDQKLGGILLDSKQAGSSNLTVVCGLGVNVNLGEATHLPADIASNRDLPATDLKHCLGSTPPIADLAAAMITAFITTTERYITDGFNAFSADWAALDWLHGRRVRVEQQQVQEGIVAGIAPNGALILKVGNEEVQVVSGSVRPIAEAAAPA